MGLFLFLFITIKPGYSAHLTWAQYKQNFQKGRYPAAWGGDSIVFRFLLPYNYNPSQKYPLVLTLHGMGERGTDDTAQLSAYYLATSFADSTSQVNYPCFVIAPQCPGVGMSGPLSSLLSWVYPLSSPVVSIATTTITTPLRQALAVVDSFIRIYSSIDTNRLYIGGMSMGGYGTWNAISRYPNKFAAAFIMCGTGDTSSTVVNSLLNMPIWLGHGQTDPLVPILNKRLMDTAFEKQSKTWLKTVNNTAWTTISINGVSSTWANFVSLVKAAPTPQLISTEFTATGHNCWDAFMADTLLIPWLMSKSKSASGIRGEMPDRAAVLKPSICAMPYLYFKGTASGNFMRMNRSAGTFFNLSGQRLTGEMPGEGVYIFKRMDK